jgi:hypothetical protein
MSQPTGSRRLLAVVSAVQLATGIAGMVVGLRRRHPYDVFWMHGHEDEIGRDALFKGTALSAPVSMLLTQGTMTAVVALRPSRRTAQTLGGLGATLVSGYLSERLVWQRLRPSGWDPSRITAAGGDHRTGSGHGRARTAGLARGTPRLSGEWGESTPPLGSPPAMAMQRAIGQRSPPRLRRSRWSCPSSAKPTTPSKDHAGRDGDASAVWCRNVHVPPSGHHGLRQPWPRRDASDESSAKDRAPLGLVAGRLRVSDRRPGGHDRGV